MLYVDDFVQNTLQLLKCPIRDYEVQCQKEPIVNFNVQSVAPTLVNTTRVNRRL